MPKEACSRIVFTALVIVYGVTLARWATDDDVDVAFSDCRSIQDCDRVQLLNRAPDEFRRGMSSSKSLASPLVTILTNEDVEPRPTKSLG
jgi:hypothetical protein